MDFSWHPDQVTFKDSVVEFARRELNGDLIDDDRTGKFVTEKWSACAKFGVLGWAMPAEYGGTNLDALTGSSTTRKHGSIGRSK